VSDEISSMLHRHLNHQYFTSAAIDDIITRGKWNDWAELRQALLADGALLEKVEKVCRPHLSNPYAQRYYFWMHYVEQLRKTS